MQVPAPPGGGPLDFLMGEMTRGATGIPGQGPAEFPQQQNEQYPTQLPGEALSPAGWPAQQGQMQMQQQKQIVREEVLEGHLMMRAVDPYNFYWLPGSKFNKWAGTIEEIEIPKWELIKLADKGYLDKELIKNLGGSKIPDQQKQSWLRFNERPRQTEGVSPETQIIRLTEYYGPIIIDGEIVEEHGHVILANDEVCLFSEGYRKNPFWHQHAPYIAFSPLSLPFRTEGVGIIEMVRAIDKALSRIANLSVDTLMFRLMPLFEINEDVFENPEDFETGMTPGKIFRRRTSSMGQPGIVPVQFADISQGAVEVSGQLDRSHQEGALVGEIQQGIPRFRGAQTATEIQEKSQNQQTFFGGMAGDIEIQAVRPLVEMALELVMQFIDTAGDPRVASILGIGAEYLKGMSKEDLMEMIQGEYKVKVTGISGQLEKADMLQNLVQLMNLIGQNPQAWLPYINQSSLLQRILDAFRPAIHDIENIIASPEMVAAQKAAMANEAITGDLVKMLPQLVQMGAQAKQQQAQQAHDSAGQHMDQQQQIIAAAMAQKQAEQQQPAGGAQ